MTDGGDLHENVDFKEGKRVAAECFLSVLSFIYTNFFAGRDLDFIYTNFSAGQDVDFIYTKSMAQQNEHVRMECAYGGDFMKNRDFT